MKNLHRSNSLPSLWLRREASKIYWQYADQKWILTGLWWESIGEALEEISKWSWLETEQGGVLEGWGWGVRGWWISLRWLIIFYKLIIVWLANSIKTNNILIFGVAVEGILQAPLQSKIMGIKIKRHRERQKSHLNVGNKNKGKALYRQIVRGSPIFRQLPQQQISKDQ